MFHIKLSIIIVLIEMFGMNQDPLNKLNPATGINGVPTASAQSTGIEIVSFTQLQKHAETKNNDTLYIVNFWATWCKPCVQEMPYFEEASRKFLSEKVKIIYVSLNSVKEVADVKRFTKTKNIQNSVLLLNAPNPNDWIDKIDPSWTGSIPATVMYKAGKKVFFKEGSFTQEEINSTITLNNKKNKL